jgi:hypothetical protein
VLNADDLKAIQPFTISPAHDPNRPKTGRISVNRHAPRATFEQSKLPGLTYEALERSARIDIGRRIQEAIMDGRTYLVRVETAGNFPEQYGPKQEALWKRLQREILDEATFPDPSGYIFINITAYVQLGKWQEAQEGDWIYGEPADVPHVEGSECMERTTPSGDMLRLMRLADGSWQCTARQNSQGKP